tara:strand:+ start:641 stop:1813 length:1173 start_codon:yes stop_codon:yes gene_type:complete
MGKVTPVKVRGLGIAIAGIGLIALSFFLTTYVQYYDDIGSLEKKGDNSEGDQILTTADLPLGLLLQIEILGALILTFGGMFGVFGYRDESTRTGLFMMSFLACVAFISTFVIRTGVLWGTWGTLKGTIFEGNCEYFGNTDIHGTTGDYIHACPTTRHEATRPTPTSIGTWNITSVEPLFKSDCIFWFWDNTATFESLMDNPPVVAKKETLKNEMLENMNWADKKNYGYMAVDSPCTNSLGATDCIADGRTVYETIETNAAATTDKYGVTIVTKLPGPAGNKQIPDITYCYYWGCNEHCNEYRYRINRLLHYGSASVALFSVIFFVMSANYSYGTPIGYNAGAAEIALAEEELEEGKALKGVEFKSKWRPMNVQSNPSIKRRLGDSRTLRF